ncbi:uncharacterized protein B4U79_10575, partial [Dinothrombium tinctorium]
MHLYRNKDHIQEILNKWEQIDDEIWAKIICMELNRRVAKAYARAPVITVNGSTIGFDGYRVGLRGFENPKREACTKEALELINDGIKLKMDESGNILIKRLTKCEVFVKPWGDRKLSNSIGKEIDENGKLEMEKASILFDMKKFHANIGQELKCAYPDRKNLESQCITCIAFGADRPDLLAIPSWIMIINVVALELVKCKLPPIRHRVPKFVSIFDVKSMQKELAAKIIDCDEKHLVHFEEKKESRIEETKKESPKLKEKSDEQEKKLLKILVKADQDKDESQKTSSSNGKGKI